MPRPSQSLYKTSGFQFNVCCKVFYCGFPYIEYGQYLFPDPPKPLDQQMVDDIFAFQASGDKKIILNNEAQPTFSVDVQQVGGCNLAIPCVLLFGCPAYEYNYKNARTGESIAPLPQIKSEEPTRHQSGVVKTMVSTRSAKLELCCCGPHIILSRKHGFFALPNAHEQAVPIQHAPQPMTMG